MFDEHELKALTATVGAAASIASAIITGIIAVFIKRRADAYLENLKGEQSRLLEHLKFELTYSNKVKEARLDYEYEARKHLYLEVEPMLFNAHFAVASAHGRLKSLLERLLEGFIHRADDSFMENDYYLQSTVYRTFLPIVFHRLLSRKLSQLDVTLEPTIGRKFIVLSIFADIFASDFDLAKTKGFSIPYDPHSTPTEEDKNREPGRYNVQGLVRGDVEAMASMMIETTSTQSIPMEWLLFEQQVSKKSSKLSQAYVPLLNVLVGFHPDTHPVVSRVLISYLILSDFYCNAREFTVSEYDNFTQRINKTRYLKQSDEIMADKLHSHYSAACLFIREKLESANNTYLSAMRSTDEACS